MIDIANYWYGSTASIQLIRFITILIVGTVTTRIAIRPVASMIYRGDDDRLQSTIKNVATVTALFITFTLALNIAGFGDLLTVLTTFGAAATVAIGFGVRDQISNVLAGVFLYANTPFVEGDRVRVNETEGIVKDTSLRTTTVANPDGSHIIPNGMITTTILTNQTRSKTTTQHLTVTTTLDHTETAQNALQEALGDAEHVQTVPAPKVTTTSVEPDTVTLRATYTIKSPKQAESVKSTILNGYTDRMQQGSEASETTGNGENHG